MRVAVAVALVTMCLCWLLLLPRLTLVHSRHLLSLLPCSLSLPSTVTTTNSHQTRLFLPYNQRGQREKFARFMHAWSTRVCATLCVSESVCRWFFLCRLLRLLHRSRPRSQSHFRALSYVSCLPRCLAFQLASHQKLDACLFYWHVNLCDATSPVCSPRFTCCTTLYILLFLQVFHFCIYCI